MIRSIRFHQTWAKTERKKAEEKVVVVDLSPEKNQTTAELIDKINKLPKMPIPAPEIILERSDTPKKVSSRPNTPKIEDIQPKVEDFQPKIDSPPKLLLREQKPEQNIAIESCEIEATLTSAEHQMIVRQKVEEERAKREARFTFEKELLKQEMQQLVSQNQELIESMSNEHQRKLQELTTIYQTQMDENKKRMDVIAAQYEFSLRSLEAAAEDEKKGLTQELTELQQQLEKLKAQKSSKRKVSTLKKTTLTRSLTKAPHSENNEPPKH
jgi:chromosome segregation ATPase